MRRILDRLSDDDLRMLARCSALLVNAVANDHDHERPHPAACDGGAALAG